jgi:hypothetical protein
MQANRARLSVYPQLVFVPFLAPVCFRFHVCLRYAKIVLFCLVFFSVYVLNFRLILLLTDYLSPSSSNLETPMTILTLSMLA